MRENPGGWTRLLFLTLPAIVVIVLLMLNTRPDRRRPASAPDEPTPRAKVEIDPQKLVLTTSPRNAAGLQASFDAIVPAGTRLVAILNNECLNERGEKRALSASAAHAPSLSEKAFAASDKDEIPALDIQAYAYDAPEETTVSQLTASAESDDCVLQITDERVRRLIIPARTPVTASDYRAGLTFNDPSTLNQGHLNYLKAQAGWEFFYNSGLAIQKDVVVAVVDTGVDAAHEDLNANMLKDANGKYGYDFVNNDSDPSDDVGHGTHVAGLIAAVADNGKGGTGVMGKRVKILAVKVIDANDEGTMSDFINGLRYAADRGADVINLSLGGPDTSNAERDAVAYAVAKGAIVISAAGNDAKVMTTTDNDYPSGYAPNLPGMLAVGSVDSMSGNISSFSNRSPSYVYIAAPGAERSDTSRGILSTMPSGNYQRMMGTSMSSPLVAGAAALVVGVLKTANIPVVNHEVTKLIEASARREESLKAYFKNGAVLDLERLARATRYRFFVDGDAGTGESE